MHAGCSGGGADGAADPEPQGIVEVIGQMAAQGAQALVAGVKVGCTFRALTPPLCPGRTFPPSGS